MSGFRHFPLIAIQSCSDKMQNNEVPLRCILTIFSHISGVASCGAYPLCFSIVLKYRWVRCLSSSHHSRKVDVSCVEMLHTEW